MSHHFYLQNGSRRSAQAFPIAIAPGAKFSEAKETFGEMLGVPPEQIICLTTADGGIVLPGQSIPEEPLILEVERRAFDMLTGAGTFASPGSPLSMGAISNVFFPALVVFVMFCGWAIILGGLASASDLCMTDSTSSWLLSNLFAWGFNSATAGSFSADTKGSWAYIITCTLNITTTILIIQAYVVVPGSYYAGAINQALIPIRQVAPGTPANFADPFDSVLRDVPADYVRAVQTMAAGVIILLVANFCWIYAQACGKMIPEEWVGFGKKALATDPASGMTSPITTPARPATVTATV
eukprot:gene27920-12945_t